MENKPITLDVFIRNNRKYLDYKIKEQVTLDRPLTDKDRCLWVLNDSTLYDYAKHCGVQFN